jgi:4-hydroxy-tetrahydrodipicolinate reductase
MADRTEGSDEATTMVVAVTTKRNCVSLSFLQLFPQPLYPSHITMDDVTRALGILEEVVGRSDCDAASLRAAISEFLNHVKGKTSGSTQVKAVNEATSGSVNIAVHGATGRLGSLILKELKEHSNPAALFSGAIVRDTYVLPTSTNAIIDVTSAAGTKKLLESLITSKASTAVIIGTTGELPMEEINTYAKQAPVAIVPNFSIGIPLVTKLAQSAVKSLPMGWNVEMTETHHTKKLDAPSGTAKKLLNAMEATGASALEGKKIPCHALRLGDVFGEHSIHLAGPGERVEITHRATRREVFAIGAVRSAVWLSRQKPGLYDELNY